MKRKKPKLHPPYDEDPDLPPYDEDPDLGDENDPAYKEEMFETFRAMGWTPDEIRDPKYRIEYAAWLEEQKGNDTPE